MCQLRLPGDCKFFTFKCVNVTIHICIYKKADFDTKVQIAWLIQKLQRLRLNYLISD